MSEWRTATSSQRVLDGLNEPEDLGEHVVAALSSAVLRAARRAQGRDGFAARAGVPEVVVIAAETGACPGVGAAVRGVRGAGRGGRGVLAAAGVRDGRRVRPAAELRAQR